MFGEKPEIIINLCMNEGLSIWGVERKGDCIILTILSEDYLKLFSLRKSLTVKPKSRIISKCGLPFCIKRIKRRLGIVIGIAVFIALNIFLSSFIWDIRIVGSENTDISSIVRICNENGLDIGTKKSYVDTNYLKQAIPLSISGISWASVNVEGSVVTVNFSESTESEKEEDAPSNIVASRDGVIKNMEVIKGAKIAETGKAVSKGDLLVSGITLIGENERYINAEGTIIAETHRKYVFKIDKSVESEIPNGKTKQRRVLRFFGFNIPLYLSEVSDTCKSYIKEDYLTFSLIKMPIGITSKTYLLTDKKNLSIDEKAAENLALQKLCDTIKDERIISVNSTELSVTENGESYHVTVKTVCYEDIGEKQTIIKDSSP